MKKDPTYVAGPWMDSDSKERTENRDTNWELEEMKNPYPWQQAILDMIAHKCKDRPSVHWVHDPKGNTGKSLFCKYVMVKKLGEAMQLNKADNIINIVFNIWNDDRRPKAFIFDLTRTKAVEHSMNDLYMTLENIKNGLVQNGKFKTGTTVADSPHVFADKVGKKRAYYQHEVRNRQKTLRPAFPLGLRHHRRLQLDERRFEAFFARLVLRVDNTPFRLVRWCTMCAARSVCFSVSVCFKHVCLLNKFVCLF